MTVCHAHANLREVIHRAHTVHALRHFNCLEQLQIELVVDEDASITAPDKQLVDCDDGAIHLTPLYVKRLHHIW